MKTEWRLVGTQNKQPGPIATAVRLPPGHWRQNDTHVPTPITSTISTAAQINSWSLDRARGFVGVET